MPISEDEWASIRALTERVIAQNGGGQSVLTTKVAKVDPDRKVIFVPEFGDQPIPLIDFNGDFRAYDADVPIGAVVQESTGKVPENYLLANGQGVSKTQYPELFAAIGYQYGGSGDTFNLPTVTGGSGGGTGVDDKHYVHTQGSLSATWNIAHGLGKYPTIAVVDTGNSVIIPNMQYIDLNNVTLTFATPTSGKAYCN